MLNSIPNYKDKTFLTHLYSKSSQTKADIIRQVQEFRNVYLHTGVVRLLRDDVLSTSPNTIDIVNLVSTNTKVNNVLTDLQERLDIDSLVDNIIEDLISYGEYVLKIEKDKRGIKKIVDNVDQKEVVAIYEYGKVVNFIVRKKHSIEKVDPDEYIHFCIGSRKIRVKIDEKFEEGYARIGRPLFYGSFDLLRSLVLLNALIPAMYLQKINNTSIIGVQVPESTKPEDALDIVKTYENLLNMKLTFDTSTGDVSVSDVIGQAGRFKVIPVYAQGKGTLEKMDPRYQDMVEISTLDDLRRSVLSTEGIPFQFMFGGDAGSKLDILKTFSRYIKKLTGIQAALRKGLSDLAMIELNLKGLNPHRSVVDVKFVNPLIDVEELDKIEFLDTVISVINNISETLSAIAERLNVEIDDKEMSDFLKKFLRPVRLENIFKPKKEVV